MPFLLKSDTSFQRQLFKTQTKASQDMLFHFQCFLYSENTHLPLLFAKQFKQLIRFEGEMGVIKTMLSK